MRKHKDHLFVMPLRALSFMKHGQRTWRFAFEALQTHGVEIRGDEAVCALAPSATLATTTDFETEF